MINLVLMSKSTHAGHACQARFEGFLGGIMQVDVFVIHHPKVSEGVRVRQNLTIIEKSYADDLSYTTIRTDRMQWMLDRLRGYAARKGLIVNVAKSEVVHFNSRAGSQLPKFRYGEDQLANADSFKYGHALYLQWQHGCSG
eukprot:1155579-Pelagomonas_calceolata.AAC.1